MEPGELNVDTRYGTLTVNGLLIAQPWVTVTNPVALLDFADLRGGDRSVPHMPGVLGRRRRRTVTRKDFPIAVTGWCNVAGERVTNPDDRYQTLIDNMDYLEYALAPGESAPAGTTGTVTATWTRPNGTTRSASVHVLTPLRLELHAFVAVGVLGLSIPTGRLVA